MISVERSSPKLLPGFHSGFWAAVGLGMAFLAMWLNIYIQETTYLSISTKAAPPTSTNLSTAWGGRTKEIEKPERALLDNDSYYWIRYAQQMVRHRELRVRFTELDNTPYGREVHWSSGYAWLCALAGGVQSLWSGKTWVNSVPDGAVWVNSILFAMVLAGLAWAMQKRAGGGIAGICVFTLSLMPGVTWAFAYGRPGHHGIHSLAALGGLTCLLLGGLGWVRKSNVSSGDTMDPNTLIPALREARRWFALAGFFGAIGLWVGATLQVFVIGSIGVGALLLNLLAKHHRDTPLYCYDSSLWLVWGGGGSIVSLGFYLLEYFPSHLFQMRLEVNHPLYQIAWVAGSVFLWRSRDLYPPKSSNRSILILCACALIVLSVPAIILLGPPEWHALRDPYMRRLHDHIMNFQPLLSLPGAPWQARVLREFSLIPLSIPLFIALLVIYLWKHKKPGYLRIQNPFMVSAMIFLIPAALILGAWTLKQVRWSNLFTPVLILMLLTTMIWIKDGWPHWRFVKRTGSSLLLAAIFLPFGMYWTLSWSDVQKAKNATTPDAMLARAIATRDVALNLKRYSRIMDVRVMSAPTETPSIHYFGGVPGTGSLYWENIQGVRDAADFFGDYGESDALAIARRREITFVVVQEDSGGAMDAMWVKRASENEVDAKRTLAFRLSAPGIQSIPKWLEPIPFYSSPAANFFKMRLYRVHLENAAQ